MGTPPGDRGCWPGEENRKVEVIRRESERNWEKLLRTAGLGKSWPENY